MVWLSDTQMECKKVSDHVYLTNLFKKYTKKRHFSTQKSCWATVDKDWIKSYPKLIRIDTIRWWKKYGAPACMDKLLKLSSHIYAKRPPFLMGQIRVWTTYTDYGLDYRFCPPAHSAAYKLFTSRIQSYSKHTRRSICPSAHGIESTLSWQKFRQSSFHTLHETLQCTSTVRCVRCKVD